MNNVPLIIESGVQLNPDSANASPMASLQNAREQASLGGVVGVDSAGVIHSLLCRKAYALDLVNVAPGSVIFDAKAALTALFNNVPNAVIQGISLRATNAPTLDNAGTGLQFQSNAVTNGATTNAFDAIFSLSDMIADAIARFTFGISGGVTVGNDNIAVATTWEVKYIDSQGVPGGNLTWKCQIVIDYAF